MIEATALIKRFGAKVAVDRLSFTVSPGHVTGFLGPNGAGKSTTLRMILGLDRPSGGEVTIDGAQFTSLTRPLHHVGALLDATAIPGGRTGRRHLEVLAACSNISRGRVTDVLAEVGLAEAGGKRAGTYSLGMKQRLGIAAALIGDPAVLIFDEPFNGLDPDGIRWARNLFRRLAIEGRTVFVASHLMSEMALTADQLIVIGQGRLVAAASVADFTARSGGSHVIVESPRAAELSAALRAAGASVGVTGGGLRVDHMPASQVGELALAHGIAVHELHTVAASLEDAFMELTSETTDYKTHPAGTRQGAR